MPKSGLMIRNACAEDARALTEIACAAKRHWNYPDAWIRRWEKSLTISCEYLVKTPTFVADSEDRLVGFCAVQTIADEALLDHLWVLPSCMRRGIGRALFQRAEEVARARGARRMKIVGDPHAE